MKIHCNLCSKPVSMEVPKGTVVRAWVECPECVKKKDDRVKKVIKIINKEIK